MVTERQARADPELKRKLDELFPNREQEREEAAWEAHLRRMEEEEAEEAA